MFQILTKRHERLAELAQRLPWPPNVWVGVSIENRRFVHRADYLRSRASGIASSQRSVAGELDGLDLGGIDWLIAGGESGPAIGRCALNGLETFGIDASRKAWRSSSSSGAVRPRSLAAASSMVVRGTNCHTRHRCWQAEAATEIRRRSSTDLRRCGLFEPMTSRDGESGPMAAPRPHQSEAPRVAGVPERVDTVGPAGVEYARVLAGQAPAAPVHGFGGPGQYAGAEPGSPLVMFDALLNHARFEHLQDVRFLYLFIEQDARRVRHLRQELAKIEVPGNVEVHLEEGAFETKFGEVVDDVRGREKFSSRRSHSSTRSAIRPPRCR